MNDRVSPLLGAPRVIELTEESVTKYLDACIRHWREKMSQAERETVRPHPNYKGSHERLAAAGAYVDAFQSVRVSLFGELLPREGG